MFNISRHSKKKRKVCKTDPYETNDTDSANEVDDKVKKLYYYTSVNYSVYDNVKKCHTELTYADGDFDSVLYAIEHVVHYNNEIDSIIEWIKNYHTRSDKRYEPDGHIEIRILVSDKEIWFTSFDKNGKSRAKVLDSATVYAYDFDKE